MSYLISLDEQFFEKILKSDQFRNRYMKTRENSALISHFTLCLRKRIRIVWEQKYFFCYYEISCSVARYTVEQRDCHKTYSLDIRIGRTRNSK